MSDELTIDHDELVEHLLSVPQEQPGRCADDVYKNGQSFCCLAGQRSWMIEAWVKKLSELSGVRTDWSFFGGRAIVSYLGSEADARALARAADATRPALEEAALKSASDTVKKYGLPAIQWHQGMFWPGVPV